MCPCTVSNGHSSQGMAEPCGTPGDRNDPAPVLGPKEGSSGLRMGSVYFKQCLGQWSLRPAPSGAVLLWFSGERRMCLFLQGRKCWVQPQSLSQMCGWTMSQISRCLEPSVRLLHCPPIFYVVFFFFYNIHVLYTINKSFWLLKTGHPHSPSPVHSSL